MSLGIWDTAGGREVEALSPACTTNGAKAAVLAFDPCNARSFEKLKFWVSPAVLRWLQPVRMLLLRGVTQAASQPVLLLQWTARMACLQATPSWSDLQRRVGR